MIEAVFRRTRVTVGVMTSAKLLSAVEPVIRYQRGRFRGAETATPGSMRYELGLQQREDALHRLVDVWAAGEASASLGFAAARLFDELDPLERERRTAERERGIAGGRAQNESVSRGGARGSEAAAICRRRDPQRAKLESDRNDAFRAAGFAGRCALSGDQAVEHRLRARR